MNNETSLSTFPSNKTEALTMLYLQQQDISKLTPEELAIKYLETKLLIHKGLVDNNSDVRARILKY